MPARVATPAAAPMPAAAGGDMLIAVMTKRLGNGTNGGRFCRRKGGGKEGATLTKWHERDGGWTTGDRRQVGDDVPYGSATQRQFVRKAWLGLWEANFFVLHARQPCLLHQELKQDASLTKRLAAFLVRTLTDTIATTSGRFAATRLHAPRSLGLLSARPTPATSAASRMAGLGALAHGFSVEPLLGAIKDPPQSPGRRRWQGLQPCAGDAGDDC